MMRSKNLHTVCESARCPNLPECWSKKTATFMILGDTCTRSCGFCAIKVGKGLELDPFEPLNVAKATKELGLKHVVVTSVARDDLKDQGSEQFAKTIRSMDSKQNAIPIIAITGNANNYSKEDFEQVGINAYIPKPLNYDSLVEKVKEFTNDN